ncbi:hypothetical protein D5R95_04025 [Methanosalsum natronophilum]|uniref:Uncharacterized protein n=1 Tax=Methanosalsum natronophilum TaxID=768733 RepID=A0A424YYV9_9EURY|nr:MAG: hypothetical protein D5R95_04025 [Methanosalsum natronophilum]
MNNASTDNSEIEILTTNKLLEGVIKKHEKLLENYKQEFEELDNRLKSLKDNYYSQKKEKDRIIERCDVLKEKRQQLYHQAEQALWDFIHKSDQVDRKVQDDLMASFKKVRKTKNIADEKEAIDNLNSYLNEINSKDKSLSKIISLIQAKVNEARIASEEFFSIDGTDIKILEDIHKTDKIINEIGPRHEWLEKRIKSHEEALNYWSNQYNAEKTDVVV